VFGIVLIYRDKNNKIVREYFDVVSEILSHDSKFVHESIKLLLETKKELLNSFTSIYCFNDGG